MDIDFASFAFRWIDWNLEKIAGHGLRVDEVEHVVNGAGVPYPAHLGDGKWRVWGATPAGRWVQVAYLIDDDGTDAIFVIHARPLDADEARQARRHLRNRRF